MLNIEEHARKYRNQVFDLTGDRKCVEVAEQGFKQGAKFSQQWYNIKDKLPDKDSNPSFNHCSELLVLKDNEENYHIGYYDFERKEWYNTDDCPIMNKICLWKFLEIK